ncbi:MAG: hypothetical protein KGH78_03790 [Candidatus Micrarchaeota archaeon]|nr:hypothetical protein [Candidatus Micrarchaeota archaeon]
MPLALFLLFFTIGSASLFAQSSANVVASVTVLPSCSFALTLNALPSYTRLGSITMQYTLQKQTPSCTISTMNGAFTITEVSSSNVVLTQGLTANNVGLTPQTSNVVFNTNTLKNTTYTAAVSFTFNGFTNTSSSNFALLNPQNISLVSLSAPPSVTVGSPITLQVNALNFGQLASGAITLYVNIIGPGVSSYSYNEPSLSPGQSSIYSISITNATAITGTYSVNAFATYTVGNNLNTSNTATTSYSVVPSPSPSAGGGPPPSTNPITAIPQLRFTSAPLFTPVSSAKPVLSQLGFENTGSSAEILKLSLPSSFNNFITLSTNTLYILPGQQVSAQLFVSPNASVPSGTYIVPLTLNLNVSGVYTTQTEYFSFNLYLPSNKSIEVINQIILTNNTNNAYGIVQITNPTSQPATNIILQTLIPLAAADSVSDISTTGLPATVVDPPGFYTITWQIPSISPKSAVYGYYTISQPRSQKLLQAIQNVIAIPSPPGPASILKVVNIAFPTFYTNSSGNIQIFALYTGTTPQPISFTLTAPSGVRLINSSQILLATPNQLLSPSFNIITSSSQGTYLLNLYITAHGFNASYTLPLIVLNKPVPSGGGASQPASATTTISPFPIVQIAGIVLPFGGIGIIIIVIGAAAYLLSRYLSRPRYRRETSEQLVRLREQIKRSENEQ